MEDLDQRNHTASENEEIALSEENQPKNLPRKKSLWQKVMHWLLGIAGGGLLLLVLLTALLYVPTIQDWIVQGSIGKIEKATGWDVEIGAVRVRFPMKIKISGVKAKDPKTGEMVGEVNYLMANVSLWPIIKGLGLPVSGIDLNKASVDYAFPNDSLLLKADIGRLMLRSFDMDLKTMKMDAQQLMLRDARVDLTVLVDTISKKEPSSPSPLVVLFDRATLSNVFANILILPDSTQITALVKEGDFRTGEVNIKKQYYQAKEIELKTMVSSVGVELEFIPMPWFADIYAKDARYGGPDDIQADIQKLSYETGDGWKLLDGRMKVVKNFDHFYVDDFKIKLPESQLSGYIHMPFDGWLPDSIGTTDIHLRGTLNPTEINRFIGQIDGLPNQVFDIDLSANGNVDKQVEADLLLAREGLINLQVQANANQLFDKKNRRLSAEYSVVTGNELMGTVVTYLNKGKKGKYPAWRIPEGIKIDGDAQYTESLMKAAFRLDDEGMQGLLNAELEYKPRGKVYFADLNINSFDFQKILPRDSIGTTSASIVINGKGTDFYSPKTSFLVNAAIDTTSYKGFGLKSITLLSELHQNQFYAAINSPNEAIQLTAQADATIKKNDLVGSINIFVDTIIPSQIGLKVPIIESARLELRSNIRSDLKEYYEFGGEIENFYLTTDKNKIHPTNTYLRAHTTNQTMNAEVTSGDLSLKFESANGLKDFSSRVKKVMEEVKVSLADSLGQMNMAPWIEHYPDMKVDFTMGRNNLLRAYLDEYRIGAASASLNLATKTGEGLSGLGVVSYLQRDTFRIDNVDLVLRQDSSFFTAVTTVHKERFRNQMPFNILLSLTSNVKRSEAYLSWLDSAEKEFINLGLELWNKPNGDLTFGFTPDPVILAYNVFSATNQDYVTLPKGNSKMLEANVELTSPEGATIRFMGMPSEEGHLSKIKINQLKLSQLDGIEFVPDLKGLLDAEIDWLQTSGNANKLDGLVTLKGLEFEKKTIGDIQLFADVKQSPKDMLLNSQLLLNDEKVMQATYFNPMKVKKGQKFAIALQNFPLDKANPFLPSKYARLSGFLEGEISNFDTRLSITEAKKRAYNGAIRMRDAELYTPIANETYILDNRPIIVSEGKARFNKYALSANDRQMLLDGTVDLEHDFGLDLRVLGDDILLLNSEKTRNTMVFGVVNADANLRISGPLNAIKLRGNIDLLGNTNVTYQSQKSELQNRNRYKGLVTFTDFSDTLFVAKKNAVDSLTLGGMDIRLGIHLDPATKVNALLTKDGDNRFSIQGGGDFNLIIPPYGDMNLNGTYDIQEGDINLALTAISRKFNIRQGSRIIWNGDLLEPKLDFKATSRIRSSVASPGEPPRQVDFDVNIIAEDRLDQLKLRFETEAPQDLSMRNILAGMSPEEQNRQSIMLLTTGLFIGGNSGIGSKGFDVNSALTSLLASQINSLAGEALNAEINLGISDASNTLGQGTNYSYSITKRFYNDRINFTLGGKMVAGQAATGLRQSFIDNLSVEYRLDQAGTHYLRFFHNKNYENLLDGEVTETGAGYLIRRRHYSLWDLFRFNSLKKPQLPDAPSEELPSDSIPDVTIVGDSLALPVREDSSITSESDTE